ncbi:hypothetical protein M3215_17795 [Bacillus cytotoxicus]|uniref:Uncharacterized protein n=1 Tax=Bacillus cytotoxicus TaxID=580165 RepID=A0ACC6AAC7_9BACI|nr:hypothetical protein [Bacillus cytotoxicus]
MNNFLKSLIETLQILGFYIIGVIVTVYILEPIYKLANVQFQGNVWVICVATAFILYCIYRAILKFAYGKRIPSPFFTCMLLLVSLIIIIFPFFKGITPY